MAEGRQQAERVDAIACSCAAADGLAAHLEGAGWQRDGEPRQDGRVWWVSMVRWEAKGGDGQRA